MALRLWRGDSTPDSEELRQDGQDRESIHHTYPWSVTIQQPVIYNACRASHNHYLGDHIFGLLPVLAMRLNGAGGLVDVEDPRAAAATSEDIPVSLLGVSHIYGVLIDISFRMRAATRDIRASGHTSIRPQWPYIHPHSPRHAVCRTRASLAYRPSRRLYNSPAPSDGAAWTQHITDGRRVA